LIENSQKSVIANGYYRNKLSVFDTKKQHIKEITAVSQENEDIWHQRMGHIGARALSELSKRVKGVKKTSKIEKKDCNICIQSKITAKISRKPLENSSTYLELIYSDIGGPYTPKTIGRNKYYITFLNLAIK
jgi:GAG-pre-integrase domain